MENEITTIVETPTERERILHQHIEKIQATQASYMSEGKGAVSRMLAFANLRRELGVHLIALREATDSGGRKLIQHGEWERLFATAKGKSNRDVTFDFDYLTATRYIAYARKHPEPITDPRQLMTESKDAIAIASGEDPEGESPKRIARTTESSWIEAFGRVSFVFQNVIDKRPIEDWSEIERESYITRARPMVDTYIRLGGTLDDSGKAD